MTDRVHPSGLPYRDGVGIMLLNADGKVFTGQRLDSKLEAWQMPQGGIDPGETPVETAFRELAEETGVTKAEVIAEARDWLFYDLPDELIGTIWKGRYAGQRQKWFAMRFVGTDADVDIATAHPEFRTWRWSTLAELADMIVPFKRDLYAAVLAEFGHLAHGPAPFRN
ncbi:MAG: RNA pyrophosphohydrolase [Sphingomonadaceae bacterium]|nr:RNA pyrophosphohydrolase [Sphingomonadaceae bacterium]